jgi:hypothetical protein
VGHSAVVQELLIKDTLAATHQVLVTLHQAVVVALVQLVATESLVLLVVVVALVLLQLLQAHR